MQFKNILKIAFHIISKKPWNVIFPAVYIVLLLSSFGIYLQPVLIDSLFNYERKIQELYYIACRMHTLQSTITLQYCPAYVFFTKYIHWSERKLRKTFLEGNYNVFLYSGWESQTTSAFKCVLQRDTPLTPSNIAQCSHALKLAYATVIKISTKLNNFSTCSEHTIHGLQFENGWTMNILTNCLN